MKTHRALLALAFLGCAGTSPYAYAPVSTTSAELDGRPVAIVQPAPDAGGELRITALGVTSVLPPLSIELAATRALRVRVRLSNEGSETWTFDAAAQELELGAASSRSSTVGVTPTGERPPIVLVSPHEMTTVDLAFPLGARDAVDLPGFDFVWTMRVGERPIVGRVSFARRDWSVPAVAPVAPAAPLTPAPLPPTAIRTTTEPDQSGQSAG